MVMHLAPLLLLLFFERDPHPKEREFEYRFTFISCRELDSVKTHNALQIIITFDHVDLDPVDSYHALNERLPPDPSLVAASPCVYVP